jgi:pilus assembly protein TadC
MALLSMMVDASRRLPASWRLPGLPGIMPWAKAQRSLRLLFPESDAGRYATLSLLLSLAAGLAVYGICSMLGMDGGGEDGSGMPLVLYAATALSMPCCMAFLLFLPDMDMRKRISEMESSMPFFLRSLGMLLDMGIPFQRAMELSCDGDGALAMEIRHVLHEVESGMGFQRALVSFAMTFDSPAIKRTVSQMLSAYEIGGSGDDVRKIGDELLALEQHRLKDYSARSSMFGLLFIMTSAVAPTFFLVYAIAGRFAATQALEPAQIAIALLVIFPLVSVLLLMLSKATMSRSAFARGGGLDARMLAPGAVLVLGFWFFPEYLAAAMALAILTAAWLAAGTYNAEHRLEELERNLPDALFSVSGMPKATRAERIFEMMENGGYGALSLEAGKSRAQVAMNVRLDSVLDDLWQRNPSPMLKRTCMMMKQMMDTNSIHRLDMLAEDMTKAFQTVRERSQMFAMQKYTLIFGAVLIPLIMKMTMGLLGSIGGLLEDGGMDAGFGGLGGFGTDSGTGDGTGSIAEIVRFALSIVPPYLVIYAIIASAAIADAEGKRSSAAWYFIALCAASLLIFHFINL